VPFAKGIVSLVNEIFFDTLMMSFTMVLSIVEFCANSVMVRPLSKTNKLRFLHHDECLRWFRTSAHDCINESAFSTLNRIF
jgi:hypothetical protein